MKQGRRKHLSISPPPIKRRRLSGERGSVYRERTQSPTNTHNSNWLYIYSWNINGITPFLQPSLKSYMKPSSDQSSDESKNSLRGFLRRHQWPQILHLQEVKIKASDEATCRSVERAVNLGHGKGDDGPSYTVKFCLPKDKYNARAFGGKVYGVATIVRDDFLADQVETIREVDWDLEGRILVTETKSGLCIFNIYAVNGTSNAYRDPLTGKPAGTRHDRKLRFHELLLQECKELEITGRRVILSGDLNVAPARIDGHPNLRTRPEQHVQNRADFNEKFLNGTGPAGLKAVDSFRHLHPAAREYTYVPRNVPWGASCDRVDLILVSKSIVADGCLKQAGILMTPAERGPSDHVPLFVSLDIDSECRQSSD